MKNEKGRNLRPLLAEQQALPDYLAVANKVSEERAEEIAAKFGDCLADTRKDFDYANTCSAVPIAIGPYAGKFANAEKLYFGYVYDL